MSQKTILLQILIMDMRTWVQNTTRNKAPGVQGPMHGLSACRAAGCAIDFEVALQRLGLEGVWCFRGLLAGGLTNTVDSMGFKGLRI